VTAAAVIETKKADPGRHAGSGQFHLLGGTGCAEKSVGTDDDRWPGTIR